MKLSAVLIVKNEEEMLPACLASIAGVDEIIICDTGSTDSTVELAKKHTDKVFTDYTWNDNFSEARNHASGKATGDWILTIDADELFLNSIDDLRVSIKDAETVGLKAVEVKMVSKNRHFYNIRAFKKDPEIYWKGAIHNYLTVTNGHKSNLEIEFRYSPAHKSDPNRALRILLEECKDSTKVREFYYLGREYIYRKDWKNAIHYLTIYTKKPSTYAAELADGHFLLAWALWNSHKGHEARQECSKAIAINTNFKEAILLMADMSGPINKKRWLLFADSADNSGVLFVREHAEKGPAYYDKLFEKSHDMSRYQEITGMVSDWCGVDSVLEIGCGTAELANYLSDYQGIDFSKKAVEIANDPRVTQGNAYEYHLSGFDTYVLTEVLEHLDDLRVLKRISKNSRVVFSVPSFTDPSHIRVYTKKYMAERFSGLLHINKIVRFNWHGKWVCGGEPTNAYILLCDSVRI